jgi:hypothetical protein
LARVSDSRRKVRCDLIPLTIIQNVRAIAIHNFVVQTLEKLPIINGDSVFCRYSLYPYVAKGVHVYFADVVNFTCELAEMEIIVLPFLT